LLILPALRSQLARKSSCSSRRSSEKMCRHQPVSKTPGDLYPFAPVKEHRARDREFAFRTGPWQWPRKLPRINGRWATRTALHECPGNQLLAVLMRR